LCPDRRALSAAGSGCSRPAILNAVNRLLRILFLALFLSPQLGELLLPTEAFCEEKQDCCTPDGVCHANCVQCACCTGRMTNLPVASTVEPHSNPPRQATIAALAAPLAPPPTDILHVPKSSS
jgi:hypothetical protein